MTSSEILFHHSANSTLLPTQLDSLFFFGLSYAFHFEIPVGQMLLRLGFATDPKMWFPFALGEE